jgi:hypothetical protein
VIRVDETAPDGTKRSTIFRIAVIEVGRGNVIKIVFIILNQPKEVSEKYLDAIDRMLVSIKRLPAK